MKKFAYAAIALAGAAVLILATPEGAGAGGRGGGHGGGHGAHGFHGSHGFHGRTGAHRRGGRLNIGPLATRRHVTPRNIGPLAGRNLAGHGRRHGGHHHADTVLLPAGGTLVTAPVIIEASAGNIADDAMPPATPEIAHPVIRTLAESQRVCTAQYVTVPSPKGGDKTVTIIRC